MYLALSVTRPDEEKSFSYPSITPELTLIMDDLDGNVIGPILASGATVGHYDANRKKWKVGASLSDVKIEVFVTEARVVLICKKYDKGGGWIGGGTALVLNAGSKILAANRRRGKALTGQMRYPWIGRVLFQPKRGFGGMEALKFVFTSEGASHYLQINLDKNTDSAAMAYEILRRVVAYRLAETDEKKPEAIEAFKALLEAGPASAPPKGEMGEYVLPTRFPAGAAEKYAPAGPPSTLH